ncbi:MAG TPA: hypothetical protein VNO70_10690 [Blastocatellia bacterium]|nr:hypothetical protein [Blastocatellia bacterium]
MSADLKLPNVAAPHRTAMIIVLALALGIVIYILIGVFVLIPRAADSGTALSPMPFLIIAVLLAVGSIMLRRMQLNRARLQAVVDARGIPGLVNHLVTTTIICAALGESIGALAIVVAALGGSEREVITLGLIGLLIVLRSYPSRLAWERIVDHYAMYAPDQVGK